MTRAICRAVKSFELSLFFSSFSAATLETMCWFAVKKNPGLLGHWRCPLAPSVCIKFYMSDKVLLGNSLRLQNLSVIAVS